MATVPNPSQACFGDPRTVEIKVSNPNVKCCFCDRYQTKPAEWGDMLALDGVVVHHFCLLFSAMGEQNGQDDEGIHAFLPQDIKKEVNRGKRLMCRFCKKKNATIGCVTPRCPYSFHYPCGYENGCLNQFFGQFESFCPKHKPRQTIPHKTCRECPICFMDVDLANGILPPCCGKQLFHRRCLMEAAKSAGYFFKCPLCNSKEEIFLQAMRENGVFIPQQDAAWEREENEFFRDMTIRYSKCDAAICLCPHGRDFVNKQDSTNWDVVRCYTCGSSATHMKCSDLSIHSWECPGCQAISSNSTGNDLPIGNNLPVPALHTGVTLDNPEEESSSDVEVLEIQGHTPAAMKGTKSSATAVDVLPHSSDLVEEITMNKLKPNMQSAVIDDSPGGATFSSESESELAGAINIPDSVWTEDTEIVPIIEGYSLANITVEPGCIPNLSTSTISEEIEPPDESAITAETVFTSEEIETVQEPIITEEMHNPNIRTPTTNEDEEIETLHLQITFTTEDGDNPNVRTLQSGEIESAQLPITAEERRDPDIGSLFTNEEIEIAQLPIAAEDPKIITCTQTQNEEVETSHLSNTVEEIRNPDIRTCAPSGIIETPRQPVTEEQNKEACENSDDDDIIIEKILPARPPQRRARQRSFPPPQTEVDIPTFTTDGACQNASSSRTYAVEEDRVTTTSPASLPNYSISQLRPGTYEIEGDCSRPTSNASFQNSASSQVRPGNYAVEGVCSRPIIDTSLQNSSTSQFSPENYVVPGNYARPTANPYQHFALQNDVSRRFESNVNPVCNQTSMTRSSSEVHDSHMSSRSYQGQQYTNSGGMYNTHHQSFHNEQRYFVSDDNPPRNQFHTRDTNYSNMEPGRYDTQPPVAHNTNISTTSFGNMFRNPLHQRQRPTSPFNSQSNQSAYRAPVPLQDARDTPFRVNGFTPTLVFDPDDVRYPAPSTSSNSSHFKLYPNPHAAAYKSNANLQQQFQWDSVNSKRRRLE